jgi:hypothetical protein
MEPQAQTPPPGLTITIDAATAQLLLEGLEQLPLGRAQTTYTSLRKAAEEFWAPKPGLGNEVEPQALPVTPADE